MYPENSIVMNKNDADRLGLKDGDQVKVTSATNPEGVWDFKNGVKKPMIGKVMAIGPGKIDEDGDSIPMSVKIGDKVLFTKYAPHELKVEEKEYLVIREDEILAIIE